jgi:hypothetical protein
MSFGHTVHPERIDRSAIGQLVGRLVRAKSAKNENWLGDMDSNQD